MSHQSQPSQSAGQGQGPGQQFSFQTYFQERQADLPFHQKPEPNTTALRMERKPSGQNPDGPSLPLSHQCRSLWQVRPLQCTRMLTLILPPQAPRRVRASTRTSPCGSASPRGSTLSHGSPRRPPSSFRCGPSLSTRTRGSPRGGIAELNRCACPRPQNKYILSDLGFKHPVALTTIHLLFQTVATRLLRRYTNMVDKAKELEATGAMNRESFLKKIVPVGFLFSASLVLSNWVYLRLSVSFSASLSLSPFLCARLVRHLHAFISTCSPDDQGARGIPAKRGGTLRHGVAMLTSLPSSLSAGLYPGLRPPRVGCVRPQGADAQDPLHCVAHFVRRRPRELRRARL